MHFNRRASQIQLGTAQFKPQRSSRLFSEQQTMSGRQEFAFQRRAHRISLVEARIRSLIVKKRDKQTSQAIAICGRSVGAVTA